MTAHFRYRDRRAAAAFAALSRGQSVKTFEAADPRHLVLPFALRTSEYAPASSSVGGRA